MDQQVDVTLFRTFSMNWREPAGYKFFHEMNLTNAFHQIPLAFHTSNILSVMTPWGLKRPKFMPGGIAPARLPGYYSGP